jgi:DNA-binding transcriptional MerR regulator
MSQTEEPLLTIGEVSKASGRSRSAIRFYESRGVLATPERVSGQRRYTPSVIRDLALIRTAQAAGFSGAASLPEIRDLFVAGTRGNERLRELARARAALVEGEIARLRNVRSWLTQASDCGCEDLGDCELFAASTCAP